MGSRYLAVRPAEAVVSNLLHGLELSDGSLSQIKEIELRMLSNQIRQDFRNGRVLKIHGWTLSITELRIYALIHLTCDVDPNEAIS